MTSSPTSPLNETQPTSLNILFSRDPEQYTRQDLDTIIAELRKARQKWRQDELEGKPRSSSAKKAPAAKKTTVTPNDLLKLLSDDLS